jgi:hypothetical protein
MKQPVNDSKPEYDHTRILEKPDGYYWRDEVSGEEFGPFPSLTAAMQDMEYNADSDYEPGETLEEAEEELGISDWIDPETGLPAEESSTHLTDN